MNHNNYYIVDDIEKSARMSSLVGDILQFIYYYAGELTQEDIDSCLEQVKDELEAISNCRLEHRGEN